MKAKTNELKKANDVQSKRDIIDEISGDQLFSKISKTYSTMRDSRQALLDRYHRIEERKALENGTLSIVPLKKKSSQSFKTADANRRTSISAGMR